MCVGGGGGGGGTLLTCPYPLKVQAEDRDNFEKVHEFQKGIKFLRKPAVAFLEMRIVLCFKWTGYMKTGYILIIMD